MLLAGDPIVVGIEPTVVRDRDVVEPSAALEVRDGVRPTARVIACTQLPNPVGVPRVDVGAVGPPGGRSSRSRMSAGPKNGQKTKGHYEHSSDCNGFEHCLPLFC
jgi:hypothetical protein